MNQLKSIEVRFPEPVSGYWDGGKKSGGTFTAAVRWPDNPETSFVEWGCWELNHFFRFPAHYEKGGKKGLPLSNTEIVSKARRYLRKIIRVSGTVIK